MKLSPSHRNLPTRGVVQATVACLVSLLIVLAGCGTNDPEPATEPAAATGPTPPHWPDSFAGLEHTWRPDEASPGTKALPSDGAYSIDTGNRELVRLFYRTVYASTGGVASGWFGNPSACNAGDTSAIFKSASLRRINWFRAMAGVPATIAFDETLNQRAQQAAMLMSANGQINHAPPSTWSCYSASAADAAGKSNLGLGINGPDAVEGYVAEPGASNSSVGHRRWLLFPQTRFMGIGDIGATTGTNPTRTNALWVIDANAPSTRPAVRDDFVAWPPRGYVPYQTVYPRWSFSYPRADFSAATVTMTENGQPMATRKEPVATGFGENTLAWLPGNYVDGMRWSMPSADTHYQVTVANVLVDGRARSFSYAVTVFDPQSAAATPAPQIDAGPAELNANQVGTYTFTTLAGVSQYQWRSLSVAQFSLNDGAESGGAAFSIATSAGYSAIDSQAAASGANAYHLAHTQALDQTLLLNQTLVGTASASLSFASRLGLSSAAQIAMLEVSTDEAASWSVLWQQAGQQSGSTSSFGESGFTTRVVSLAALADKTFRLRFRYALNTGAGPYYPQAVSGVGWYVDDIRITGAQALSAASQAVDAQDAAFSLTPATAGDLLLQVRPGLFGYYSDWSTARRVAVLAPSAPAAELLGSSGDDLLAPGAGSHRIDGLAGQDTVSYSLPVASYRISRRSGQFEVDTLSGAPAHDQLVNIERLRFSDGEFSLVNPPRVQAPAFGQDAGFLFDFVYYRLRNPASAPVDPAAALAQYLGSGAAQGRAPNPWFDPVYYGNRWPDLTALNLDAATLFRHYNLYGVWEGRSAGPLFDRFDGVRYLSNNPDVAAYVDAHLPDFLGSRSNGAIAHYLIYGAAEGRAAFDRDGQAISMDYASR